MQATNCFPLNPTMTELVARALSVNDQTGWQPSGSLVHSAVRYLQMTYLDDFIPFRVDCLYSGVGLSLASFRFVRQ